MRTFDEDMNLINQGWSAQVAVQSRATLMRSHDAAGKAARAEEYAMEITSLQAAEAERKGLNVPACPNGKEEWRLSISMWSNILVHAFRRGREFWMPIGATPEQAATEARRVFFEAKIRAPDVSPVYPALMPIAAE